MLKTGLVSATFRRLSAGQVIGVTSQSGNSGIEWSSDFHVPPGGLSNAGEIRKNCQQAGISVCGYASYYRLGENHDPYTDFKPILMTAKALQAPIIRIWAGAGASSDVTAKKLAGLYDEARLLVKLAEEEGMRISYEYHPHTLTDSPESALRLLEAVSGSSTHWQISPGCSWEDNCKAIQLLSPYITTIHVQNCKNGIYYPLEQAYEEWKQYIIQLRQLDGDHDLCLEFVKDESISQFMNDTKVLEKLITEGKESCI